MDFSHYTDHPVRLAMDLVNTLDPVSGDDRLGDVAGLGRFLDDLDVRILHPRWTLDEDDVAAVAELRRRLRQVFHAQDEHEAAQHINDLLARSGASPRVSVHGGVPHMHFEPVEATPAGWLGAVTAMGLGVVLCEEGSPRLGVCSAATCQDVFIDTSRNRSRRYCSDKCSTRENVAAYRRRRRA